MNLCVQLPSKIVLYQCDCAVQLCIGAISKFVAMRYRDSARLGKHRVGGWAALVTDE